MSDSTTDYGKPEAFDKSTEISPSPQKTTRCDPQQQDFILQEALRLRALGYRVLPINPSIKRPWIKWKQFQSKIPSESTVLGWFRKHPESGIGISTDGLVVIDDDNQGSGNEFSRRLANDGPHHPIETTPRGGRHHIFREPHNLTITSSANVVAELVDVRARGGFLVIAPTVRPDGGAYVWLPHHVLNCRPAELPEPPGWLIAELQKSGKKDRKNTLAKSQPALQPVDIIRNVRFTSEAGYLRRIGASKKVLTAFLVARNDESNDPLEKDEIEKIATSVARYDPDKTAYEVMGGHWPTSSLGLSADANLNNGGPFVRLESLAQLEQRRPPNDLIPGLVPDKALVFVYAKPAAGKSLLLEAIAFSVALGIPLMGTGPTPARTGWVLLLLSEGSNSWGARSVAFREHYKIPLTDQIVAVTTGADFTSHSRIEALTGTINEEITQRNGQLPIMIILDTLSGSIPGVDENQQSSMTLVCGALQSWASAGVAVVVAHHLRKDGTQARGSSVIEGAAERSMIITRSNNLRIVKPVKVRDGVGEQFTFEVIGGADNYPVPVAATSPAMDFLFETAEPGLAASILACGFNETGGPPSGLFATGVSINSILKAWLKREPIEPKRTLNQRDYDKERNRRIRALTDLILGLFDNGTLKVTKGSLTQAKRSIRRNAEFVQVVNDGDD
ncbi:bifunctional DNA primase/polymerase [bacterium]|nr:bifunctional DNA primase/polymerase [bacterium]